nr:hypothetical protein [Tanacetum cinerariifolium]
MELKTSFVDFEKKIASFKERYKIISNQTIVNEDDLLHAIDNFKIIKKESLNFIQEVFSDDINDDLVELIGIDSRDEPREITNNLKKYGYAEVIGYARGIMTARITSAGARWAMSLPLIPLVTSSAGTQLLKVYQDKLDLLVEFSLKDILPSESEVSSDVKISAESDAIIKTYCGNQWPEDYSMRVNCIKEQKKAVARIKEPRPIDVPQTIFERIMKKAVQEWPQDFTMQVHSIEEQVAAYRELQKL